MSVSFSIPCKAKMVAGKYLAIILIATAGVAILLNDVFRNRRSLSRRESWSTSHGFLTEMQNSKAKNMEVANAFADEKTPLQLSFMNDEGENAGHHDAYPDQMSFNHEFVEPAPSRRLSASSALVGTFYPLTCNANLTLLDCGVNKTSTLIRPSSGGDPFTIPCGTCYLFDLGSNVSLPTGLRVMGKLVFPMSYQTTVYTSFVIVQGEMVVRSNSSVISPDNLSVHFLLTGTNDTVFDTSSSYPNTLACNNSLCNVGKKPFIVAGGNRASAFIYLYLFLHYVFFLIFSA